MACWFTMNDWGSSEWGNDWNALDGTQNGLHGTIRTENGTQNGLHGTIGTVNGTQNGLHGTILWCSSTLQGLYKTLKGYCLSFCLNFENMQILSNIDSEVISSIKEQLFIPLLASIRKFDRNMTWKLPPFNFYHPWQKFNSQHNWLVIWL